ncbi:MAG: hypothetical protein NTU48_06640 [Legionellales bacterium]|nr:hypothetical protein [Legionellales bacterium]
MTLQLNELKQAPAFITLNKAQFIFDSMDDKFHDTEFTRSPYHALTFLIAYAGLDEEQRKIVVQQFNQKNNALVSSNGTPLNCVAQLDTSDLDVLINSIDWSILSQPSGKHFDFEFQLELPEPSAFYRAIQVHCPSLHTVMSQPDCLAKVIENESPELVFTTKVSQTVSWKKAFERKSNGNLWQHWEVPAFEPSPQLTAKITELAPNTKGHFGAFYIEKGCGNEQNKIILRISAPKNSKYDIEKKLEVNSGIYLAFIGVLELYGLPRVDRVSAELIVKAEFSATGASASQAQIVTMVLESACYHPEPSQPTIITIDKIHAFFSEIEIGLTFKGDINAAGFDPNIFISLLTETDARVDLFSGPVRPANLVELLYKDSSLSHTPTPPPSGRDDSLNPTPTSNNTNFSFYLKCFAGLAISGGGLLLIAGLMASNSLFIGAGAVLLVAGGFAAAYGMFARPAAHASTQQAQLEDDKIERTNMA